jgi:hypothetical protein
MGHQVLLAQVGREGLTNYKFVLEAPWKACRLCGSVYQSDYDRHAYRYSCDGETYTAAYYNKLGEQRRQRWLELHNKRMHPNYDNELRMLNLSGLPVTPTAAGKLATYGIVPLGATQHEEIAAALFEAPRAPINDAEG